METLAAYGGSSSEDESNISTIAALDKINNGDNNNKFTSLNGVKNKMKIQTAPVFHTRETTLSVSRMIDVSAPNQVLTYNPKYSELQGAVQGPENPFQNNQQKALRNTTAGFIEGASLNNFHFNQQRKNFHILGYAHDPTSNEIIGDRKKAFLSKGIDNTYERVSKKNSKRRKEARGDVEDLDSFKGPWAKYVDQKETAKPTEKEQAVLDGYKEAREAKKSSNGKSGKASLASEYKVKCVRHISDTEDYLGNSFIDIPNSIKVDSVPEKCYLPKKEVWTFTGHTKGVACMQLFPKSGHLILSAGMDGKIKLWEFYGKRRCIQTYHAHSEAVKDISFNNDGSQFISVGYDKMIRLWDTESGECLKKFTTGKVPYVCKFNPNPSRHHMILVGFKDKKIIQWNLNTEEIVQEYDRHLGAINSITFTENGERFVSTSDDNSIRVWEWEIPVDFKLIADPSLFSMPTASVHPDGKWMCLQAMDNQIFVIGASGRYRMHPKKRFKGHMSAGYACQMSFSPDGKYIISGDSEGKLIIWDWKTGKIFSRLKAHQEVTISCLWHPHETSSVLTCSWDGTIKLWS